MITTQKIIGGVKVPCWQAETNEERKSLRKMLPSKHSIYGREIQKDIGTSMSPRRYKKLHTSNNRKWTSTRNSLRQVVEVKIKTVNRIFPDGSARHALTSHSPKKYKVISHAPKR